MQYSKKFQHKIMTAKGGQGANNVRTS